MNTDTDVHTCNYYCERPECVRRQRDELRDRMESSLASSQQPAPHPAITHCENCGCDWLDNGLNPIGCPYCKQPAAVNEALLRMEECEQNDQALLRQALEGLRERCAREAEHVTGRRRTLAAMMNNEAVKPCEMAAAIRKIDMQQYYECAVREIKALRAEVERLNRILGHIVEGGR